MWSRDILIRCLKNTLYPPWTHGAQQHSSEGCFILDERAGEGLGLLQLEATSDLVTVLWYLLG